jgi:hypothetical protein
LWGWRAVVALCFDGMIVMLITRIGSSGSRYKPLE